MWITCVSNLLTGSEPHALTEKQALQFQDAPLKNILTQIRKTGWDSGALLSVEGDWGAGKTTIVELLEKELATKDDEAESKALSSEGKKTTEETNPHHLSGGSGQGGNVKSMESNRYEKGEFTAYVKFNVWKHESDPCLELSLVSEVFRSELGTCCRSQ